MPATTPVKRRRFFLISDFGLPFGHELRAEWRKPERIHADRSPIRLGGSTALTIQPTQAGIGMKRAFSAGGLAFQPLRNPQSEIRNRLVARRGQNLERDDPAIRKGDRLGWVRHAWGDV